MTITFYRNTPLAEEPQPMTTTTPKLAPSPIVRAFGGATVGFECMECNRLHPAIEGHPSWRKGISAIDFARQNASDCCGNWHCEKHGKVFPRTRICGECHEENRQSKELAAYEKAKKIPLAEYKLDFVYRDGYGRDGYISVGDLDDYIAATDPDKDPKWAFGCWAQTVSENDADLTDHVAEGILGDHHEDAMDFVDTDKVKEASRIIFEACKDVVSYMADESVVVIFEHKQQPDLASTVTGPVAPINTKNTKLKLYFCSLDTCVAYYLVAAEIASDCFDIIEREKEIRAIGAYPSSLNVELADPMHLTMHQVTDERGVPIFVSIINFISSPQVIWEGPGEAG